MQPAFADAGAVLDGDGLAHAFVFDQAGQTFARAVGIAGNDHRPFLKFCFNMCGQSTEKADSFLLPLGREVTPQASARIQHIRTRRLGERLETDHAFADQRGFPRGVGQVQPFGRCGLIDAIHLRPVRHRQPAGFVLIRDTLPSRQTLRGQLVVQRDRRPRHIVEQGLERLVKERHPVFCALMLAPCADRFIQRIIGARGPEFDPVVLAETGDSTFVKDDFADGGKLHELQLFCSALRHRIKATRPVQRIAKEVQPHRAKITGWENVDDAAADRVVARLGHRRALDKAHADKESAQSRLVYPVAHTSRKRGIAQHIARRHPLGRGV